MVIHLVVIYFGYVFLYELVHTRFCCQPKNLNHEIQKESQLQSLNFHGNAHSFATSTNHPETRKKTPNTVGRQKMPSFQELEILRNELHFEELQAEARRLDEMRPPAASTNFSRKKQGKTRCR